MVFANVSDSDVTIITSSRDTYVLGGHLLRSTEEENASQEVSTGNV